MIEQKDVRTIYIQKASGESCKVKKIMQGSTLLWHAPMFKYVSGGLTCPNGIKLNNYSESSAYFYVEATFRCKEYGGYIYQNDSGSGICRIYVGKDGYLHFDTEYSNVTNNFTFTELGKIELLKWYCVKLRVDPGRSGTVELAGNSMSFTNARYFAVKTERDVYIGSDAIDLKGTVTVIGTPYSPSTKINTLSFSIEDCEEGEEFSFSDESFSVSGGMVYTEVE